jgi:RNA polymerase sigma-70 factor (ECF subfamily)
VGDRDLVLAARLAAGDDRALAELFDLLGPAVHSAALSVLRDRSAAQDVVQDVFVELWSSPGRYDRQAGSLRGYLVTMARNRALDLVRSESRLVARQERCFRLEPAPPDPCPAAQMMTSEVTAAVRTAILLLPTDQRRIVELVYLHGLTCREASQAAGIPEGTAKSRLRLARARLEGVLDRQLLEST